MAPHHHLDWLRDNVEFFDRLTDAQLAVPVPNCPGWAVEDVLSHLSFGLGLAYPVAMASKPGTPDDDVFASIVWPTEKEIGRAALERFSTNLANCISAFEQADPDQPCWTYAGPGRASFWFRRAAIETALHRIDVEEAIASTPAMPPDRAYDAIVETVEFALPFATTFTRPPAGALDISCTEIGLQISIGDKPPSGDTASISGSGQAVLCALWGRELSADDDADVQIGGDLGVANEWLTLIERAFAGR